MGKEKYQTECERIKNHKNKVEQERHNQFALQMAFALRNKGFTGTTMEVSAALHLSSATSSCHQMGILLACPKVWFMHTK